MLRVTEQRLDSDSVYSLDTINSRLPLCVLLPRAVQITPPALSKSFTQYLPCDKIRGRHRAPKGDEDRGAASQVFSLLRHMEVETATLYYRGCRLVNLLRNLTGPSCKRFSFNVETGVVSQGMPAGLKQRTDR